MDNPPVMQVKRRRRSRTPDPDELLALAKRIAAMAAAIHRRRLGEAHTVSTKSSRSDVVTEVDREAVIVHELEGLRRRQLDRRRRRGRRVACRPRAGAETDDQDRQEEGPKDNGYRPHRLHRLKYTIAAALPARIPDGEHRAH